MDCSTHHSTSCNVYGLTRNREKSIYLMKARPKIYNILALSGKLLLILYPDPVYRIVHIKGVGKKMEVMEDVTVHLY